MYECVHRNKAVAEGHAAAIERQVRDRVAVAGVDGD